jgi:hypothetical protein
MRKFSCPCTVGIGLLVAGFSMLLACFLPYIVIVCIQAILLILAGLLIVRN